MTTEKPDRTMSEKPNRTMPEKANETFREKPQLSSQQKENIKSAYNARKGGYISEEQYRDNLSKNGINLPKEKLERERLEALTGQYDLKKANPKDLDNHIKLKNKTPSNYYSEQVDDKEQKRRIDEVFGPKTDFSLSNYENNYDKFNKEEK